MFCFRSPRSSKSCSTGLFSNNISSSFDFFFSFSFSFACSLFNPAFFCPLYPSPFQSLSQPLYLLCSTAKGLAIRPLNPIQIEVEETCTRSTVSNLMFRPSCNLWLSLAWDAHCHSVDAHCFLHLFGSSSVFLVP